MTSRKRKFTLFALSGVVAALLLFIAFRPHPVAVDLVQVTRGPLVVTINADGKTRIRNVYDIFSPISGTAQRSPVSVGDEVVRGDTVAVVRPGTPSLIDSRSRAQLEAAVREAEAGARLADAQLVQAEEELKYAQTQFDRTKALVERGVASLTSLEDAQQILALRQASKAAADSQVDMSQSSLSRARAALIEPTAATSNDGECCVSITAPVDGRVLSVAEISERTVAAGSPLLTLGDPQDLEIVADLLSADAVGLEIGARTIVERWGGHPPLEAKLRELSPLAQTKVSSLGIEEQRVNAVFDLVTPPQDRAGLGHQFAVFLRIVTWETDDTLQVPLSAIFRHDGGWAVFVANGGKAILTPVETGERSDRMVQLLSGLDEGQTVISHPSDTVTDGIAIIDRARL